MHATGDFRIASNVDWIDAAIDFPRQRTLANEFVVDVQMHRLAVVSCNDAVPSLTQVGIRVGNVDAFPLARVQGEVDDRCCPSRSRY